ncbi:MAG: RsmB/NOP family class I SAM-dependent RNA methyltransferase [Betaproteobacteria bacterium]|nr:RsmB/NOP family class I SAM-dependent RNA methyltransferase [Betaproteobacteria bacterium]
MHPKALMDACTELVRQVLKFDHAADAVVSQFFKQHRNSLGLGPRERFVLSGAVYNVLRHKLLFDHLSPSGSGPKERRMAILGWAHHLDQPDHTNGASPGSKEFLRSALSEPEKRWLEQCAAIDRSALLERHRHNLPEWLVTSLKAQLSERFWDYVTALNRPQSLDLRVNAFLYKRSEAQAMLAKERIASEPTAFSPWGLRLPAKTNVTDSEAFAKGAVEVQDEGSQLLALLVDAKRGEMVVDFCAGAGGKTLALGAGMRNTGRLYAMDTSAHRLDGLKPRLARSGLSNVHPVAIAHERDERIKRLSGKVDRVLVDAPCTGLGTLRRSPDLKWRQNPEQVQQAALLQNAILDSAARLLKTGGRLVYATCSTMVEENEAVAEAFGQRHPQWVPMSVQAVLTDLKVDKASQLCAHNGLYLRMWPHLQGTDGFFAAVWHAP